MAKMRVPLILNKRFGTYPMLVHASGKSEQLPLWPSVLRASEEWRIDTRVDPNLSIITFNNGGQINHEDKRLGLFEESLRRNGVSDVTVLGSGITDWKNNLKIKLLIDHLAAGKAKDYVLLADSADVILANDLGPIVETFKTFGCRALFNAERRNWPADLPPFEQDVAPGELFPFLNSGVWIAEASFAREIAEYCAGLTIEKHGKSDQARYKIAYRHFYPMMRVDHHCVLFQNINRVDTDIVELCERDAPAPERPTWTKHLSRLVGR